MTTAPEVCERLLSEGLIPLPTAAAMIPTGRGKPVSVEALVRWIKHGRRGVKLEATRGAGDHWWTSRAAVARFLAGLSGSAVGS